VKACLDEVEVLAKGATDDAYQIRGRFTGSIGAEFRAPFDRAS
jgi:hypothetical protein